MSRPGTGLSGRLCALLAVLAVTPVALVLAGSSRAAPAGLDETWSQQVAEVVQHGAALYAFNCAVCHGEAGGGLEEAKLAFPEDHRNCTRCHRPNNRVIQPLTQPFIDNDMFSIGDPPPLHDPTGLAAQADPVALLAYVSATMPRYDPGRLTEDEYRAVTAHLLTINGRTDEAALLVAPATPGDGD